MGRVTFHGFDGFSHSYRNYGDMIEAFAASVMPVGWEWGDEAAYDRDFIAQQDRYKLVEMFNDHDDCIEVLMLDGKPIGVLDNPHISLLDLRNYAQPGKITRPVWSTPSNDIWHRIARRRA